LREGQSNIREKIVGGNLQSNIHGKVLSDAKNSSAMNTYLNSNDSFRSSAISTYLGSYDSDQNIYSTPINSFDRRIDVPNEKSIGSYQIGEDFLLQNNTPDEKISICSFESGEKFQSGKISVAASMALDMLNENSTDTLMANEEEEEEVNQLICQTFGASTASKSSQLKTQDHKKDYFRESKDAVNTDPSSSAGNICKKARINFKSCQNLPIMSRFLTNSFLC